VKAGKILGIFKKGAKAAAKSKGKKGAAPSSWPSGIRIGVFGHANSGKTVYFTVLNEESKVSKDLQLSITDTATASDILSHYRAIWGVGTESGTGTVVDLRGEKTFPDPTVDGQVFQFNAILDRKKKFSVVTYDYDGKAVSLNSTGELKNKVTDFMLGCDGILFFFDPKILSAEMQTHSHVASFVSLLEQLAPLSKKLPIPMALVITKSDILPGFTGEERTVLIGPEDEHLLSEDFELFLEKILAGNKIASDSSWAGTVRNLLVKTREFLKVVIGRTLNFQIFFVSATGQEPEKIGSDVGRSLYAPPPKIKPIGIREPFYWLLHSIAGNKRISKLRSVAKYVAVLSIVWMILYSLPFLYHHNFLLNRAMNLEDNILKDYSGNIYNTTQKERRDIINTYRNYENAWVTRNLFPMFRNPVTRIRAKYEDFDLGKALGRLDEVLGTFSVIVKDKNLWPRLNPSDTTLIETEEHKKLVEQLNNFHRGDETTTLFKRSDRALVYWDLFTKSILSPGDTAVWSTIRQQIEQDQNLYAADISGNEKALGDALLAQKIEKVQKVEDKQDQQEARIKFDEVIENVNSNNDPDFRLDRAVRDLRTIRRKLDAADDAEAIASIDKYIDEVKEWEKRQTYKCKIVSVPDQGHLHIEVVEKGKDPSWAEFSQIFPGDEFTLRWKAGDEIHIAYDTPDIMETWGKEASDKRILGGKFAIFQMDGDIVFSNVNKTINISFTPSMVDRLPVLE